MTKKKKPNISLSFLKSSWISALFFGATIGIVSQRIPQLRAYTDELIQPIEQQLPHSHNYVKENSVDGQPISSFLIHRNGYSLAYDARNRNPSWIYEHLTADNIIGDANRSHFDFKEDEKIPPHLRATLADYKGQGFDRGHMAPAADHRSNQEAMSDTFFMTNTCPQCPEFNRGYWLKLEKHVRDLTKSYPHVHVFTGPLYLPHTEADGKRYIKYQLIGQNDVAVPTHFFKIIVVEDRQRRLDAQAYILPNEAIHPKTQLESFRATIEKIEHLAGIIFPFRQG